jgi:hypothetical protein
MYAYPLLTFNFALSNFNGFTFHSHYRMQSRLDIDKAHPQHNKLAGMYCNVGYGRHAIGLSKPTSMASLLIRSIRPLLSRA